MVNKDICRSGGTGRRVALKMLWGQPRESSSLSFGTLVPFFIGRSGGTGRRVTFRTL